MGDLRELAETDLTTTLESELGFGWPVTITDPAEAQVSTRGQSGDISQMIDPETGQAVSGRLAHVAFRIKTLRAAGLANSGIPTGIVDGDSKPWLVAFNDLEGDTYTFKVRDGNPDRTIGIVTCTLEPYEP